MNSFEQSAIAYTAARVDDSIKRLQKVVSKLRPLESKHSSNHHPHLLATTEWVALTDLLRRENPMVGREHIIQHAFECVTSTDICPMLLRAFGNDAFQSLWSAMRFVARPILDCRMIHNIARKYPQFRETRILPVPARPKTGISLECQIDIQQAWYRLAKTVPSDSDSEKLSSFFWHFKEDLPQPYGLHAEMQLFMHYDENPGLAPTYCYFGCSKKACLACETFLQALPNPFMTRGRHGICYPAWGVPRSRSEEGKTALNSLREALVDRITALLAVPAQRQKKYFELPVRQSTFVAEASVSIAQDPSAKSMLQAAKEQESARIERRRIR